MKTKQSTACLLSGLILTSALLSCGNEESVSEPDTQTQETAASTETAAVTEEVMQSPVPEVDFGGTVIRTINNYFFDNSDFMIAASEATGDIVNDAIYTRNINLESKFNVKMEYESFCHQSYQNAAEIVRKSVISGADEYDLMFAVQFNTVPEVLNKVFLNLEDLEGTNYLNLDQPWWYQEYINELSVGEGATYFAAGDITLGILRYMSCMFVNKDLYRQYYESPDEIYDMVLDGKWTMDTLHKYCTEMYQDLNGNGEFDENDRFGTGVITLALTDLYVYDGGVRATDRDANNVPYLTLNNEQTVGFMQKMYSLFYENPGVYVFPSTNEVLDVVMPTKFNADELLVLPGWLYTSEILRDMEVDYAVVPFPKYDENQTNYLSIAQDLCNIVCIPATCQKTEAVTAVMEEMAFLGYRDILPAYYEIALKVKYIRDGSDEAIEVLDMIHDNVTTDFAYIYNYALNNIGLLGRELMGGKTADFSSLYQKKEKAAQKKFDKLLEAMMDLS